MKSNMNTQSNIRTKIENEFIANFENEEFNELNKSNEAHEGNLYSEWEEETPKRMTMDHFN